MSYYNHFTISEREKILYLLGKSLSITEISKCLNRNKSSISREIKRNSINGEYSPSQAQEKYTKRRKKCKRRKILSDTSVLSKVKYLFLELQWSPEQISNRLKLENNSISISANTIYRGVYAGVFDDKGLSSGNRGAIRKLRHRGKTRHTKNHIEKRGKIKITNLITDRPKQANTRDRIGDWEADTVLGLVGQACLLTLVDRKSRYLLCEKLERKTSNNVKNSMIKIFKNNPLYTITPDRGKEFSKHEEISKELDDVKFYFPFPHHPWQRGSNENTNGLIREYFPKQISIDDRTNEYVKECVDKLNKRPRKCLGWKTPYEVYFESVLQLT
ncbi:MAG: IS30 family transposase [Tissierellia bacterium]|nr:IS30 family transposase [Tissierellia bacterium]